MLYLGIDVGNSDTKSENTTFPSGYEGPYSSRPAIVNEYLELNGKYFIPTTDRLFYLKDKTADDRCIVLTLMAIAKELINKYSKPENSTKESVQESISRVTEIALGAGLPMAHYKKNYIDDLIAYYIGYMGKHIEFSYDGYQFSFRMSVCKVYPQGGAAAVCKANKIAASFNTYYVIDIGGYTVDVALIENGVPSKKRLSLELGIITLYDSIIEKVQTECDISIDSDVVQSVLKGEKTILPDKAINIITELTNKHANTILNALRQQKILFDSHPSLFVGGGSVLLKGAILKNPMIKKDAVQFITDTRANAKAYARLLKMECSAS